RVVASLLLVGMVGTALAFPLISARRRFSQRTAALALLHELGREVAALNRRALELRQTAVVAERHRVAREIHDGLGHYLMTIAIQTRVAQDLIAEEPEAALRQLQETRLLIGQAQQHLSSSLDASGQPLELAGTLAAALER